MSQLQKLIPLLALLVSTPALAAEPDPHAGRHPPPAAEAGKSPMKPETKSDMQGCPMMDPKMAGSSAMSGKAKDGKMMMEGKAMHCRPAPAAAKGPEAPRDHDHSKAAPN